jgi:hypothetical protein
MLNRKLVVVLIIGVVVVSLVTVGWWSYWQPWSVDQLIFSRATTYIEEPLRADGYPDYVEAINSRLSEGVTPVNNAAVLLLRAMGPEDIPADVSQEFFKRLGIAPLSPTGDYFEEWSTYFKRIPEPQRPKPPMDFSLTVEDLFWDMQSRAGERPWSREEFPHLAGWLDSNERELRMVVAASHFPRYYVPRFASGDRPEVVNVLLPLINNARQSCLALVVRSNLRIKEGNIEGAWDDMMACRRLGRLIGQGSFLVELLLCHAIEELGIAGQIEIVSDTDLTAEQCARMKKELDELPALPSAAGHFDFSERLELLDIVLTVAREGPEALAGMQEDSDNNPVSSLTMRGGDWNVALVMVNEWMDRYVAAASIADPKGRAIEAGRIEAELQALLAEIKGPKGFSSSFASRTAASDRNANVIIGHMFPAITSILQSDARARTQHELLRVGVALAHFKAENGDFPEKLELLAPQYLKAAPCDQFAGTPLVYRKRLNGYLLYSIGANQKDEEGRSYDASGDDLVIEVPRQTGAVMGNVRMGNGE